ncbi:MAG: hypothetical protein EOQ39_22105 [Mesorhizobium sp.]|uniref:hypothetical protein n=1 Tax=Mesorhizobium sp. TaxID=1871066 RepID=UPI000FE74418|nr:hypothetical protein [Mesorhizobium sp.]RWB00881.1 MAG: hypothetical protein EOQ37_27195 [Mesorhizobium sp.]RWB12867.1 MAG: hypothetical protein EOQ39_22105 [Mesorhizobium sp.]
MMISHDRVLGADPRHSLAKCNPRLQPFQPETVPRTVVGVSLLGRLDIWPIRGPALADDPAGKQAYAGPIDTQISRSLRRDAPSVAARGGVLQPSRFRAINSVFGHLRPGERNVLDDLSPIL